MSTKQMWHHEPSVRCPVAQCGHGHCQQCGQAGHTSHPWSGLTQHPHFWKGSTIRGKNRECFQSGHQEFWIPTGSTQNECSFLQPVPELILDQNTITFITFSLTLDLASLREMPPEINVARLHCNARWTVDIYIRAIFPADWCPFTSMGFRGSPNKGRSTAEWKHFPYHLYLLSTSPKRLLFVVFNQSGENNQAGIGSWSRHEKLFMWKHKILVLTLFSTLGVDEPFKRWSMGDSNKIIPEIPILWMEEILPLSW